MAELIGAEVHMVAPTEADLVGAFERSVYHAEQPVMSMHGPGKIILSEFVRKQGYKVKPLHYIFPILLTRPPLGRSEW
jgi:asparagine synthase (glutamine-hydrolysing)